MQRHQIIDAIKLQIPDYDDLLDKSLNLLAMNRRSEEAMSPIEADEGYTFVSNDLNGAEPNFMLGYSNDPMLEFFLKKSFGIKPFWQKDVLMTDSMYITFASSSKLGDVVVKEAFANWKKISVGIAENHYSRHKALTPELQQIMDAGGLDFPDCWVLDSDIAKHYFDSLKIEYYRAWKQQTLALFYGEGASTLRMNCHKQGIFVNEKEAQSIVKAFWKMFKDLNKFQKILQKIMRSSPCMTNPFGFRLNTQEYKVLNAYIQSSVSGFVSQLLALMDELAPWAIFVMIIHDELVYMVPEGREEDYKEALNKALQVLNNLLDFKYPIEMGAKFGKNFYTAH